jgi:hypothetical protein
MRFALILVLSTSPLFAQITITSSDMYNAIGQYYKLYSNSGNVNLADFPSIPGNSGGGNFWNFSETPEADSLLFDYVGVNADGHGADFPEAEISERKTDLNSGDQAWMFLKQQPGMGRINYGFYDSVQSPTLPSAPFNPSFVDFPDPMTFGTSWTGHTEFSIEMNLPGFGIVPANFVYDSESTVDAYGLAFSSDWAGDMIRVNEVVEYNASFWIESFGMWVPVEPQFQRNYYYFMDSKGIVAQVSSIQQEGSAPPVNFTTASIFTRMYDNNHPSGILPPEAVNNLIIDYMSPNLVVLAWSAAANATDYRVEYALGLNSPWSELITTANLGTFDTSAATEPRRIYRVISIN